jgi:hypothetical protein
MEGTICVDKIVAYTAIYIVRHSYNSYDNAEQKIILKTLKATRSPSTMKCC